MRCQLANLLLILLALLLPLAPLAAQVVVVNPSVLERELDVKKVAAIFQGGTTNWDDGQSVVLVLADDPAADRHLSQVIRRDRQMLLRAWKRLVFSGMGAMPQSASSTAEALTLVAKTTGAMVLLDEAPADPRWRVIPLHITATR